MSDHVGTTGESPNMEEVSLDGAASSSNSTEHETMASISKTSSLKRFFKFHAHKNSPSEASTSRKKKNEDSISEEDADQTANLDSKSSKRFHLRMGGMQKIASRGGLDTVSSASDPSASVAEPTSSNSLNRRSSMVAGGSENKVSLKNSISNYMKSFFKRSSTSTAGTPSVIVPNDRSVSNTIESESSNLGSAATSSFGQGIKKSSSSKRSLNLKKSGSKKQSAAAMQTVEDAEEDDDGISDLEQEIKKREAEIHSLKISDD
ncbi:uncharacterized protein LOC119686120 [Teleopsis dalmanni]|uniref:uncharacterized protein LOC119686120 n=1 Tax=Teleopsis dalmanni TaxID=139649 RepID=UPI0018CD8F86|nr:uncharacterized protein LOC119686120 [Teleopsis dalmanni]XP_037956521.1 uncharacterized protein LOC119686120 [Teleopsis dalmanni]